MNRTKFYAELRRGSSGVFGTSLSQKQVSGLERLLDTWGKYFNDWGTNILASSLGTSYHETAFTMQPIKERGRRSYFDKYEPGTKIGRVLGNTQPGDGFRFRGEGDVMNTGRDNAIKATNRLNELYGLNIDLVANPDLRGDPLISALSLFLGNYEGWWTGKKLSDFIDDEDESDDEDLKEFIAARKVVNGTDRARQIGKYSLAFEKALRAAGHEPAPPSFYVEPPFGPPGNEPKPKIDWFAWISAAFSSMFKRKPK